MIKSLYQVSSIPPHIKLKNRYQLYPILGIISTCFGTLFALALIPPDPFPPGALFNSALAISIGISISPLRAFIRNPKSAFRTEHLLALSPIYWLLLDLLQGAYPLAQVGIVGIEGAFIAIGLFVCGIWSATFFRPWVFPKIIAESASYSLDPKMIFRLILIFFSLGIFKYAYPCNFNPIVMIHYLGQNRWAAPWSRGMLGGWDAFLDHMSYFGYLLPTLTVLLLVKSKKLSLRLVIAIVLSLLMTAFVAQGGGRRVVGVMFGAALICWFLQLEKIKVYHFLVGLICTTTLLASLQLMLEYRGVGFKNLFQTREVNLSYEYLHVDDNFLRLSQIIEIVPKAYPYIYEKQIIYILVRPIPRVFWPNKPISPGFDLPSILGKKGVSLSSSVIAEWYLSGGFLIVVFGGWLYGRLANSVSLLILKDTPSSKIVYCLSTMTLFAGIRSMQDLILMSYSILAWLLVSWLVLKRQRLKSNN